MAKTDLTAERVRELFNYDPRTGDFRRNKSIRGSKAGDIAGAKRQDGRRFIRIDGVSYYSHRLAWLHWYGEWPANQIDHIDANPANNAICNLRDVTPRVNMQNMRSARSDNKSGFLGVSKYRNGWAANIKFLGRKKSLGVFSCPEDAHNAYLKAKRELHDGCTI